MNRQFLADGDYLAELNKRLSQHSLFEHGMRFTQMPNSADGAIVAGFDWGGAKYHSRTFLGVAADVAGDFKLTEVPEPVVVVNGYTEGEHYRSADNSLFRYSVRFNASTQVSWNARITKDGGLQSNLAGVIDKNVFGGDALRGAVVALIGVLIDTDAALGGAILQDDSAPPA